MKKLFSVFLTFFTLTVAMADETNGFVEVLTAKQLEEAIRQDPHAKIHLAADINLGQIFDDNLSDLFSDTFYGTIDGGNKVISQGKEIFITARLYGTKRDSREFMNCCLFKKVENAVFTNLTILNIDVEEFAHSETGLLARQAKNSVFSNVNICNAIVNTIHDNAGALVGRAEGCRFFAVTVQNCEVSADDICAGGIVGYSKDCGYQLCVTNPGTSVYADGAESSDGAYSGGLVGHSVGDVFTHCINAGIVGANDHFVGGFVGKSDYSQFIACQNCGPVVHLRKDLFQRDIAEHYKTVTLNSDTKVLPIVQSCIGASLTICGHAVTAESISTVVSELCRESFNNFTASISSGLLGKLNMMDLGPASANDVDKALAYVRNVPVTADGEVVIDPSVATLCAALWPIGVVFSNGMCATLKAYNLIEHDEVGGISGWAKGGQFEGCANYGSFACEDNNSGGIVGLGQGVVINNCYNSGAADYDKQDTTAGILGKAEPDEDKSNRKCLVTNCLSTWPFHLIGSYHIADGMDTASGNNYSLGGSEYGYSDWEMAVSQEQLQSGLVALWLNNGVENRTNSMKPWRQNLGQDGGKCPTLDPSLNVVTADNLNLDALNAFEIGTAADLYNFSMQVMTGNKFIAGVLTADIDWTEMGGLPWLLPIGSGENYSFCGFFDGQGHTISGLECSTDADMGASLFGVVHNGAVIRNVTVKDSKFSHTNDYGAAGIVGRISLSWWGNVVIENCASYADVHAKKHAGGILGRLTSENAPNVHVYIDNCYSGGTITADDGNSGLLCGYVTNHGHVSNSWSDGQLRNGTNKGIWPYSIENDKDHPVAECLVGYAQTLDIQNCYIVNPEANVDQYEAYKNQYPLQAGVEIIGEESLSSGELAYKLNKGVTDGTQTWYQTIGVDPYPVRTKLPDGSNMVLPYRYLDSDEIDGYANTSYEMISDVILGKKRYSEYRVTDVNYDAEKPGTVDVMDLIHFIDAANK